MRNVPHALAGHFKLSRLMPACWQRVASKARSSHRLVHVRHLSVPFPSQFGRCARLGESIEHLVPPRLRILMLRYSEFGPEGETTCQPRATPWEPGFQRSACPVRAPQFSAVATSQSHAKNRILFRPLRAGTWLLDVIPGRCPGLICDCPFGTST
jgi:hypothetical protein